MVLVSGTCMICDIVSRSLSISARFWRRMSDVKWWWQIWWSWSWSWSPWSWWWIRKTFVPSTLRRVVAARSRVEWLQLLIIQLIIIIMTMMIISLIVDRTIIMMMMLLLMMVGRIVLLNRDGRADWQRQQISEAKSPHPTYFALLLLIIFNFHIIL